MKELTVKGLYTLDETIAKDIFEGVTYPWEGMILYDLKHCGCIKSFTKFIVFF